MICNKCPLYEPDCYEPSLSSCYASNANALNVNGCNRTKSNIQKYVQRIEKITYVRNEPGLNNRRTRRKRKDATRKNMAFWKNKRSITWEHDALFDNATPLATPPADATPQ